MVYTDVITFKFYYAYADTEGCSEGDEVRLTQIGRSAAQGKVEVCFNGIWHSVLFNNFDSTEAQVVCGQLGFSRESKIIVNGINNYIPVSCILLLYRCREVLFWEEPATKNIV